MKNKFSITQGFLAVMVLTLVLVSTVGFLTYRQFVKVLDNAEDSGKPDPTVAITKQLIYSITDAENKVKTYTLTEDSLFLAQYESIRSDIQVQLRTLETFTVKSKYDQSKLDTLSSYVRNKITIYDSLLLLQNEFRVQQALERVNQTIEGAVTKVPRTKTQESEASTEEERRFLFFKLKKRKKREKDEVQETETASSTPASTPTEIQVDYQKVKNNLVQIQNSETSREEEQLLQEFQLLQLDKLYNERIGEILNDLENKGLKREKQRALRTKRIVNKANVQIIIFCILISFLLMGTSYTIIRYISRSNRYRKVLKRAKNEAESLARAKEHFVATVSHEIRTPMNIISGFTEQLSHSKLTPQQRDQLETVIKASSHLLQLINEVLDFTKLQNYKLELEAHNFELRETLNEVRDLMMPLAEDKGIELEFVYSRDTPNILVGDPIRLSQIMINVTSNALKFTEKGIVSVSVNPLQLNETSAIIEFAITDTGIGMSPDKLERVFEAFEQADASTSRTYGGTGLGLSITKKLIELHKGTVEVHSKEGVGTEIVIEIPYSLGENTDPVEVIESKGKYTSLFGAKIMIADDEEFNRKLIHTILTKYDSEIIEAKNGKEAVELALKTTFDIILMDARMPQLNGIQATHEIRREELNSRTPIIALSASVTEADKRKYMLAGMNDVLGKPFRESALLETITANLAQLNAPTSNLISSNHLDFEGLASLSGNDATFYIEMLETFIRSTQNGIQEMRILLQSGNFKKMGEVAHRISAPCKHLEATALYNSLKEIESATKNNESALSNLTELFAKVETTSQSVLAQALNELNRTKEQ